MKWLEPLPEELPEGRLPLYCWPCAADRGGDNAPLATHLLVEEKQYPNGDPDIRWKPLCGNHAECADLGTSE